MLAAARQPDVFSIVCGTTKQAAEKVGFEGESIPQRLKAALIAKWLWTG